jgi:hypothetical protein
MYINIYIHTCDSSLSSGVSLRSLPTLDADLTDPALEDDLAGGVNLSNGGVPFEEHTETHSSRPRPTRCATPPRAHDPTAAHIAMLSEVRAYARVRAPPRAFGNVEFVQIIRGTPIATFRARGRCLGV